MKGLILHSVSLFLLMAVGYSTLSNDRFIGENEKYEVEDSIEELKEAKPFLDLLSGYIPETLLDWELHISISAISFKGNYPVLHIARGMEDKYLLYCNLKLCC